MALAFVLLMVIPGGVTYASGWWSQWRPGMREDFSQSAATGTFETSTYARTWTVYPDGWKDTSGRGTYAPSRVLSVENGVLKFDVHAEGDDYLGAAVVGNSTFGQTYGRYSVRWRADPVTGYGLAFLLWPDSERSPDDGEIDFAEGSLDATITATAHHADPAEAKDMFDSYLPMQDWHTSQVEWTPSAVVFSLDGKIIGRSDIGVPRTPMHLVLQIGTDGNRTPPRDARGLVEVDWVHVDSYNR